MLPVAFVEQVKQLATVDLKERHPHMEIGSILARSNDVKDILSCQLIQAWHTVPTKHRVRFACSRLAVGEKSCIAPEIVHCGNRLCDFMLEQFPGF